MEQKRKQHDADLAALDPKTLPPALKIGIAPAMKANPLGTFWGEDQPPGLTKHQKEMVGCTPEWKIPPLIRQTMKEMDNDMTAREVVQMFTEPATSEVTPQPGRCDEQVGEKPNVYTDGSLKNPAGLHWAIGGVGVWWPGRIERPTEQEMQYSHCESKEEGTALWNI